MTYLDAVFVCDISDAYMMLGLIAERANDLPLALEHFTSVTVLSTEKAQQAEGHDNIAKMYAMLKQEDKAKEHHS